MTAPKFQLVRVPLLFQSQLTTVRPRRGHEPCPCASGRKYRKCCANGVRPLALVPSTPTDFEHADCYARHLGNCSRDLSREHVLGEGVLRRLMVQGRVKVRGFAWQKTPEQSLPPAPFFDMNGFFEVRVDGPRRHHYRLFCVLERNGAAVGLGGPSLVLITGLDKPFRTVLSPSDYAEVRRLGREFLSRTPRSIVP